MSKNTILALVLGLVIGAAVMLLVLQFSDTASTWVLGQHNLGQQGETEPGKFGI